MSETENSVPEETEAPEVVAHEGEEEPWCVIHSCGTNAAE